MQRITDPLKRIASLSWLPHFLALCGGVLYVLHALVIARTKTSFLDEGMYLYKGWLFVSGQATPYAEYGVQTNHSILSYLIPGVSQVLFGPGLDTGRYFMIFLSLFTLLGLWVFARRWGSDWWAAGIVWVMALNPAEIKLYTLAISEGPVAAILVWILVLTVGEKRRLGEVLLGSALTSALVLTRETMAFVPPILFLYIFWQHGWKTGLYAMLCSAVFFFGGNLFYYPDNLTFWAMRVPRVLSPFLDVWRLPPFAKGEGLGEFEESNLYRMVLYFFLTFRLHFVSLVSAVVVWLLWSPRAASPMNERARASVFLSALFLVLFVAHMQASFFGEYCISCILLYIGYCNFIGLMLLVVAAPTLTREISRARLIVIFAVIAILIVGIGFSTHEDLSADFSKAMIERLDTVRVWNVLLHVTALSPLLLFRLSFVLAVSLLVLLLGGVALGVGYGQLRRKQTDGGKIGLVAIHALLVAGFVLSPTKILGSGNDFFNCDGTDVFASYEKAGSELRAILEPGSKIYWEGRIPAIFLYLPGVQVYGPQLNHLHYYSRGGDADTLLRFNRWNDELAETWLSEADYILVQETEMFHLNKQTLESGQYVKVFSAPKAERCRWQSVIHVYQRADK
jgi:4-amino-4-deoxy-L-arabinose transferase-like glycosyltransferase